MREEYKQFERNVASVQAAFEGALANCDNEPFSGNCELVDLMSSVAAFEFVSGELDGTVDFTWHVRTIDMQVAIYGWLEILDMPNAKLSKFKSDIMRVYRHPCYGILDGVDEKYRAVDTLNNHNGKTNTLNYFRRLVSIVRGFAQKVKCDTLSRRSRCANKYHDGELNQNAVRYVFNYSPDDMAFHFKPIGCRVVLTEGQFRTAKILLCGECDDKGFVKFPDGVRIPTNMKAEAAEFFSYVSSRGDRCYRIEGSKKTNKRGGKREGAGRPLKSVLSK